MRRSYSRRQESPDAGRKPAPQRRRAEVRVRLYRGPDRKNPEWVACKILFTVYDPIQQNPDVGQVRIVRYLRAQSEAAQEVGTDN